MLFALRAATRRAAAVAKAAWSERKTNRSVWRSPEELAFLPPHLEISEAPGHPAPRVVITVGSVFFAALVAIALFARVDIVASGAGKLLPAAQVKQIQAAISGVVKAIHVSDGQRVVAGDLLIELDSTQPEADARKASASRVSASLSLARAVSLLEATKSGAPPRVRPVLGASVEEAATTQRVAQGQYQEFRDRLGMAEAELARRTAELNTSAEQVKRMEAMLPLARQQLRTYEGLSEKGFVSDNELIERKQAAIQMEFELSSQRSRITEQKAAIRAQNATVSAVTSQFVRELRDIEEKSARQIVQDSNDVTKTETRVGLTLLRSPVNGTVQQLAVHTIGGVVSPAQVLLRIVPDDALDAEIFLENKDVGFVRAGQQAVIKVDAFPYTRYGYMTTNISSVSNDAISDRRLGLGFIARASLPRDGMHLGPGIILTPGMAVTAEIKTGTRSVAAYFLDPLLQGIGTSLHER